MHKMNPKTKYQLFKQTKNFCSVPWNLVYVDMSGRIKTCTYAKGGGIMGDLKQQSIEEILNSQGFITLRQDISQDRVTDNCRSCLSLENCGDTQNEYNFLRSNYNSMFKSAEVDYHDPGDFVLSALDLHWSSLCDLKCVTCWAGQSSSIAKEQGVPVRHTPKEIAEQFIQYVAEHQSTLKEVYLSGGEPTMIKYNLQLLEKLDKRDDLLIRVNSNMMWNTDNKIVQEILKFPNVLFTCSADALNNKFEYIRRGASWDKFLHNLQFLQNRNNVELRINSVFFVLQSTGLLDTIEFFNNNFDIKNFTINQCGMEQTHLRCRNLPEHVKKKLKQDIALAIEKYHHDLNLVGQLNNCVTELEQTKTEDFHEYFDSIDKLAGTDWKQVFSDIL